MRARLFAVLTFVTLLSGCETIPPINFSVPNVGVSRTKIDAEVRSITVTLARPDETKGNIAAGMEGIPREWTVALVEALNRMTIFTDDAKKKLNLQVKILDLDTFGIGPTAKTTARYEIIDRSDGSIIFTQEISTEGEVSATYAFMGLIRLREAINRAVRNNIASFLQVLETVDVNKPMFPANSPEQKK